MLTCNHDDRPALICLNPSTAFYGNKTILTYTWYCNRACDGIALTLYLAPFRTTWVMRQWPVDAWDNVDSCCAHLTTVQRVSVFVFAFIPSSCVNDRTIQLNTSWLAYALRGSCGCKSNVQCNQTGQVIKSDQRTLHFNPQKPCTIEHYLKAEAFSHAAITTWKQCINIHHCPGTDPYSWVNYSNTGWTKCGGSVACYE